MFAAERTSASEALKSGGGGEAGRDCRTGGRVGQAEKRTEAGSAKARD
jgi:hypothetical protein